MSDADKVIADALSAILTREVAPRENIERANEPKWDSLRHIEIIFAIEGALGVTFLEEEILAIDSSVALLRFVEAKRAAAA